MTKLTRIRLADAFEHGELHDWAWKIVKDLATLTVQGPTEDDIDLYLLGRPPEGQSLTVDGVTIEPMEEVPAHDGSCFEGLPDQPVKSPALLDFYLGLLERSEDPKLNYVREVAAKISPKSKPFSAVFQFARHLKTRFPGDEPSAHRQALQLFCRLQGRHYAECWDLFEDKWDRIRTSTDADEAFDNARELADHEPYPCDERSDAYIEFVGIAYQMGKLREDRTFYFPPGQYKRAFDMEAYLLKRYRDYMVREGLIELVDKQYVAHQKCQVWKWIGPDIDSKEAA